MGYAGVVAVTADEAAGVAAEGVEEVVTSAAAGAGVVGFAGDAAGALASVSAGFIITVASFVVSSTWTRF